MCVSRSEYVVMPRKPIVVLELEAWFASLFTLEITNKELLVLCCFPQPLANPITSSSVTRAGAAALRKRVDSPAIKYASIP